jgi:hypothetical protein
MGALSAVSTVRFEEVYSRRDALNRFKGGIGTGCIENDSI